VTLRQVVRTYEPRLGWEQRRAARWAFDPAVREQWGFSLRQSIGYVRSRRTMLFGPRFMAPWKNYSIGKVLVRLGIRPVFERERRDPCAVMAWHYETKVTPDLFEPLVREYGRVINARCIDVGKDNVERVHRDVFGYGMAVDPHTHDGPYVRKSIGQSAKDGVILRGSTDPEPGFVYQRLIQCEAHRGLFEDIRILIAGRCLSACMVRLRPAESRFGHMPDISDLRSGRSPFALANVIPVGLILSEPEIRDVERFACAVGLDYGELDVLRDRNDGRIYVVDVNNVVNGPTVVLSPHDIGRVLDAYCEATEELLPRFSPDGGS
jgi:hypothetical protein